MEVTVREGFAFIPGNGAMTKIELHYSLPEYTVEETWCDEFATQESITFKWRGDQIHEVDHVGRYLAPFPKECRSFLDQN